jgi:hypothetical protein
VSPSGSVVFEDKKKDVYTGDPSKHMVWANQNTIRMDGSGRFLNYIHDRPLSNDDCQEALDYIAALVKVYPVQLRYAMARPLWNRFCEAWCDSGDLKASLNAI